MNTKRRREPERPIASVRIVQDVTDRPRNEAIVAVVDVVVVVVLPILLHIYKQIYIYTYI